MAQKAVRQETATGRRNRQPVDDAVAKTVSIAQACAELGIGTSTGYALAARGDFPVPVRKIGGTRKILKADLARYLETGIAEAG